MADLLSVENVFNLLMLIFLQAVLGFDNLLYISLESKRTPPESQQFVRRLGIGIAIFLRIALLFVVTHAVEHFSQPFVTLSFAGIAEGEVTVHAVILLAGGGFILYTALREISHMLSMEHLEHSVDGDGQQSSIARSVTMIVLMNIVFSFDSILSAMALTDVFVVMAAAIVISGVMMMVLADTVAEFLKKNRKYEVLGLVILLLVGLILLGEGGHIAHLKLFGHEIHPIAKSTFYFGLFTLILVDVAQGRYQKKLDLIRRAEQGGHAH